MSHIITTELRDLAELSKHEPVDSAQLMLKAANRIDELEAVLRVRETFIKSLQEQLQEAYDRIDDAEFLEL